MAEWAEYTSNMEGEARSRYESSIKGHIVEAMLTHCFHFRDVESFQEHLPGWDLSPGLKPAEYLVAVNYDEELFDDWVKPNGQKVSRPPASPSASTTTERGEESSSSHGGPRSPPGTTGTSDRSPSPTPRRA